MNNEIATMDIETVNWTEKFLCGGLYNGAEYYESWDENGYFEILLSHNGVIYAHNGGRFDFLWVVSQMISRGWTPNITMQGSRILKISYGKTTFLDSYPILLSSLQKAGEMVGSQKEELGIPFSEFGNLTEGQKKEVSKYLRQDCVLLYDVLDYIKNYCETHNIILKNTIASSSWGTVKEWLSLNRAQWRFHTYRKLREGYYGGRCEVYRTEFQEGERYDRNSSYPAALRNTPLPVGPVLATGQPNKHFDKGLEGIYWARVEVPKMFIPPLPVRVGSRLGFPIGIFDGVWTGLELRYAMSHGVKIHKLKRGLVFRKSEVVFRDAINKIWRLRQLAPTKALNKWLKLFANSLTGKFAQKPELESFYVGEPNTSHFRENPNAYKSVDKEGNYWTRGFSRIGDCAHVQFAAYLTSEARISLHKTLMQSENPIYCDTDSVYSKKFHGKSGDGLGEWKREGSLKHWESLAPKVYRFLDENKEWIVKAKGVPSANYEDFSLLSEGETVRKGDRPRLFKSSIKKGSIWGQGSLREIKKTHRPKEGWVGGRIQRGESPITEPPTLEELKERK